MLLELFAFYQLLKVILAQIQPEKTVLLARIGLLLYALWRNLAQFAYSGNNTENFGLIFTISMYLAYFQYHQSRQWFWLLVAGVCLSVQIFLKPTFVILAVPIWINIVWPGLLHYRQHGLKAILPLLPTIFWQMCIFLVPSIIQAGAWSWYFTSKGVWYEFWLASWEFSQKYINILIAETVDLLQFFMINNILIFMPLICLGTIFIWQNRHLLQLTVIRQIIYLLTVITIIVSASFFLFFPYYQLIFVPILIILVVSIDWNRLSWYLKFSLLWIFVFCTVAVYVMSLLYAVSFFNNDELVRNQELWEVTKYVQANLEPGEIFYAHTYGATFYYLSKQKSPTNYISASAAYLDYKYGYGYKFSEKVLADLERHPPKLVIAYVTSKNPYTTTPVQEYVERCYQEVKQWEKYMVLQRKDIC